MHNEQLQKGIQIQADIEQLKRDNDSIDEILGDYSNFGSNIEFKRHVDSFSRSFGSKKNDIREELKQVLVKIKERNTRAIELLTKEFHDL